MNTIPFFVLVFLLLHINVEDFCRSFLCCVFIKYLYKNNNEYMYLHVGEFNILQFNMLCIYNIHAAITIIIKREYFCSDAFESRFKSVFHLLWTPLKVIFNIVWCAQMDYNNTWTFKRSIFDKFARKTFDW